jgi:uncharacterized protein (TIGR02099 family)
MQSRLLKTVYHFTIYTVFVLVMLVAVSVTIVRILFPDIGIYRGEIEAWVSRYMGYPVVIHSMDAKWQGWLPELYLTNIDLLNKEGTQPITHFDHARVLIAPVATLLNRQFIPRSLVISGFDLTIAHLSNGAIYIEGIKVQGMDKANTDKNELAEWLFKQDNIKIQNASIQWIDLKNKQDPISLSNVSLQLRNDKGRFQVEGSAALPQDYGKKLDFAFDSFGNLLSANWSGDLYLSGSDINPDKWYTNFRPKEFNVSGGKADLHVWSSWKTAQLTNLEGDLDFNNFDAVSGRNKLHIRELSYRFLGERSHQNDWKFRVKINKFLTENGPWPDTDISFSLESSGSADKSRYSAAFSYLKLDDLATLISDFSILPEKLRNRLLHINFNGELNNGSFTYDQEKPPEDQLSFYADFAGLSTDIPGLPAFSGVSGTVKGTLSKGVISLRDHNVDVSMESAGVHDIPISSLDGDIDWSRGESGWRLETNLINIVTPRLSLHLSGSIEKDTDETSPMVEMVAKMDPADVKNLAVYLPETKKFRLKKWMEKAVVGGRVNSAKAVFNGHLKDFPFDNNSGRFQLMADISNGVLDYSKFWPPVDQIDTEIMFQGRKMSARIHNGSVFNAKITDATSTMPDILNKKKKLFLKGHINGVTRDLKLFADQSPLKKNPALREVRKVLATGNFNLALRLGIPLKQPGIKPDVKGTIKLTDTKLDSPLLRMLITNINGAVSFTRESVLSEPINARYLGKPVTITVAGTMNDPKNPPIFSLKGSGDNQFIVDRLINYVPAALPLKDYLLEHVSGSSDWKINLGIRPGPTPDQTVKSLEISSNLAGLALDLPEPLNKTRDQLRDLKITTNLTEGRFQNVDLNLDSTLACHVELDKEAEFKLQKATLQLGGYTGKPEIPHNLQVSGSLDKLSLEKWLEIIRPLTQNQEKPHPIFDDADIDLKVANLDLFRHTYNQVKVSGNKHDNNWLFSLDGEGIKGDIILPAHMERDRIINLQMEKLVVNDKIDDVVTSKLDPVTMPAIIIDIDEFKYRNYDLGKFEMSSSIIDNGLSIDQFEFSKPQLTIFGNGKWLSEPDHESSKFNIHLIAKKMDAMLKTFGYDTKPVKNGKTTLDIDAGWIGAPTEFAFRNLNGSLDMQIEKGQLLDIDPSAGRLFGLLSIQALPRRLLLDFSDIFGKGLTFDSIEGGFEITDGNAYTNDLYMHGPSADITITGRTGLADKDYDQVVTVTPQIANSLPFASALFGPVGIGVGAVIYLFNSLNDNIDKLLRYQYTITGNWDNPIIKKIKDKEVVANAIPPPN